MAKSRLRFGEHLDLYKRYNRHLISAQNRGFQTFLCPKRALAVNIPNLRENQKIILILVESSPKTKQVTEYLSPVVTGNT
jgi:hypothetical protein